MMTLYRGDEGLQSFTPCNIFETKTIKEDCYEHEVDKYSQGHDAVKEDSQI